MKIIGRNREGLLVVEEEAVGEFEVRQKVIEDYPLLVECVKKVLG